MRILCALLLIMLLAGCVPLCSVGVQSSPPTVEGVVGRYSGRYQEGEETFELKAGFTFTQEFRRKGEVVYRHEGRWYIKDKDVVFDPLLVAFPQMASGSDRKVAPMRGAWIAVEGGGAIVFDDDLNYFIGKRP